MWTVCIEGKLALIYLNTGLELKKQNLQVWEPFFMEHLLSLHIKGIPQSSLMKYSAKKAEKLALSFLCKHYLRT